MRTIDLRGRSLAPADMLAAVPRATQARAEALEAAARIVDDVRLRGEAALREQAERFDRVTDHAIRVPAEHIAEAAASSSLASTARKTASCSATARRAASASWTARSA